MATAQCDGCGTSVPVAGGIADMWSFEHEPTGGITLELADGEDRFLCFPCIEQLPDHPTAADVEDIEREDVDCE